MESLEGTGDCRKSLEKGFGDQLSSADRYRGCLCLPVSSWEKRLHLGVLQGRGLLW